MKGLVFLIKRWRNRRRQNEWFNKLREIQDSFQVKELNGTLYLMCQGVPYKQVCQQSSATDITSQLDDARLAMRSYLESKKYGPIEEESRI